MSAQHHTDPTERFTDRVDAYVRYRPGYPDALVDTMRDVVGTLNGRVIADFGSGTGISSALFLRHGAEVYAVEPNVAMRAAAEQALGDNPRFHSVAGRAEHTTLDDARVDVVTAGQAFHWFDRTKARREFRRILRPEGWVVLFWNGRRTRGTPFLDAYESLLQTYGTDYNRIDHRNLGRREIEEFFAPNPVTVNTLYNEQMLDVEGAVGRLLSSSYVPNADHPDYAPMIDEMRRIVREHGENGGVRFEYDLEIYCGQLTR